MSPEDSGVDYRFSLANERTFLAWIRTSLALLAGGVAAAKALDFHHEVWRFVVATPPILAGAAMAFEATVRWATYEDAMSAGRRLPVGRGLRVVGAATAAYAVVALVACVLDT